MRLTPKLRQTAALDMPPFRAARTASSFSPEMAAGRPPTRPRRRAAANPAHDPLACQGTLVLGKRAEHMKQQLARRRRGIHAFGERTEGDLFFFQKTIWGSCANVIFIRNAGTNPKVMAVRSKVK